MLKYITMLVLIIALAFGSEMVSGDICKQCCQQLPGMQSKVTQMMYEFIKEIQSMQSGCECNRTRSPSTIGSPLKTITGIIQPHHIYITNNGEVFISGWGDGYVHKFDKYGNFQKKFAIPNGNPAGVYINSNRVYVAGFSANKIYEYSNDGVFIGEKIGQNQPIGFAVDSEGTFYVSEWKSGKVHVYHSNGTKSHVITGIGTYPNKIQFDSDDNLHVSTHYKGVYIITKSGHHLSQLKVNDITYGDGLYVDCYDNMYAVDRSSPSEVYLCSKNGKPMKIIKGFTEAIDVNIAPDGTMWIADFGANKVYLY